MSNDYTITVPLEEWQIAHEALVQNRMVRDFIMNGRVLHIEDVLIMLGYEHDAKKLKEMNAGKAEALREFAI